MKCYRGIVVAWGCHGKRVVWVVSCWRGRTFLRWNTKLSSFLSGFRPSTSSGFRLRLAEVFSRPISAEKVWIAMYFCCPKSSYKFFISFLQTFGSTISDLMFLYLLASVWEGTLQNRCLRDLSEINTRTWCLKSVCIQDASSKWSSVCYRRQQVVSGWCWPTYRAGSCLVCIEVRTNRDTQHVAPCSFCDIALKQISSKVKVNIDNVLFSILTRKVTCGVFRFG